MNKDNGLFPQIVKNIENLIEDEEGNIPGNKLLILGTMVIILGNMFAMDILAGHSSHRSHSSHSSHGSHSSGSHGNHGNHGSHESHVSHQSHTSHSNTASHSNSLYSAEGDVTYSAPDVANIPGVKTQPVLTEENTFILPEIDQNIETPNETPALSIMPSLGVPLKTPETEINIDDIHKPSLTEKIE